MAILMLIRFALHVAYLLLIGFSFTLSAAYAADCPVLEYLAKKSSASQVLVNPCLNVQRIGVGSIFKLLPEGRLWLKSLSSMEVGSNYQLICHNRSGKASKVSVTSASFHWIRPSGFAQCSDWIENKLSCKDSNEGSELFFCAIALMKKPEIREEIQRRTSVTMRGLADQGRLEALSEVASGELDQLAGFIKAEIDLCRIVYKNQQTVTVTWTVQTSGLVTEPVIKEPVNDDEFTECVSDVIRHFNYPVFPKDIQISYQF